MPSLKGKDLEVYCIGLFFTVKSLLSEFSGRDKPGNLVDFRPRQGNSGTFEYSFDITSRYLVFWRWYGKVCKNRRLLIRFQDSHERHYDVDLELPVILNQKS